jgi:tetratricopeptide (TPR) repeat protein
MRKVVFLGNCQARVYRNLYADHIAPRLGDDVSFVASFVGLDDEIRAEIGNADVLAVQLYDGEASIGLHNVDTAAKIIFFPNITGMFLWPFGGRPHPRNKPEPYLPHGPYDLNMGDRWLDRAASGRHLDSAEAGRIADDYLALDLATAAKADRLYELIIDRQRQRDAKSGFACADLIERHLHDEVIFPTAATFTLRLFRHLIGCLFYRLGGSQDDIALMLDRMVRTPFPLTARPVHPSIAKLFDLRYMKPDTRYRFYTFEFLTLREYVIRYLQYDWKKGLMEAWHQAVRIAPDAGPNQIEAAIRFLTDELRMSVGSGGCERALSDLYLRLGDHDNAFAAYCHSMVLDNDDPHAVGHYSHLLLLKGRIGEAEQVLRSAILRWPQLSGHWGRLGALLAGEGRLEEAAAIMRQAAGLHSDDPHTCNMYYQLKDRLAVIQEAAQ